MNVGFASIGVGASYYNVGDLLSSPKRYLGWETRDDGKGPLIVGGGGLFMEPWRPFFERVVGRREFIIWGAGLNFPGIVPPDWALDVLRAAKLVGIRDRGLAEALGFDWVPCASCLNPALTDALNPGLTRTRLEQDVVAYRHSWGPRFLPDLPAEHNMDYNREPREVLNFLGSARAVVTNSYHGAYWSLLLGKHVVLRANEDGNLPGRFYTGLPPLLVARSDQEALDMARFGVRQRSLTLAQCRARNNYFAQKVLEIIS